MFRITVYYMDNGVIRRHCIQQLVDDHLYALDHSPVHHRLHDLQTVFHEFALFVNRKFLSRAEKAWSLTGSGGVVQTPDLTYLRDCCKTDEFYGDGQEEPRSYIAYNAC